MTEPDKYLACADCGIKCPEVSRAFPLCYDCEHDECMDEIEDDLWDEDYEDSYDCDDDQDI